MRGCSTDLTNLPYRIYSHHCITYMRIPWTVVGVTRPCGHRRCDREVPPLSSIRQTCECNFGWTLSYIIARSNWWWTKSRIKHCEFRVLCCQIKFILVEKTRTLPFLFHWTANHNNVYWLIPYIETLWGWLDDCFASTNHFIISTSDETQ